MLAKTIATFGFCRWCVFVHLCCYVAIVTNECSECSGISWKFFGPKQAQDCDSLQKKEEQQGKDSAQGNFYNINDFFSYMPTRNLHFTSTHLNPHTVSFMPFQ